MGMDQIPLLAAIKSRLGYLGQREKLIAQNVANADTPGYAPKDLKPFTIPTGNEAQGVSMVRPSTTDPAHLAGHTSAAVEGPWKSVTGVDSETSLNGNKVTLEDEMTKMTEARMQFEAAIGFYQKSLDMLRIAARPPGRS